MTEKNEGEEQTIESSPEKTEEDEVAISLVSPKDEFEKQTEPDHKKKILQKNNEIKEIFFLIKEFLEWCEFSSACEVLNEELNQNSVDLSEDIPCLGNELTTGVHAQKPKEKLLKCFDEGDRDAFFRHWQEVWTTTSPDLSDHTLHFYLHVYFATYPIRNGRSQRDHQKAMIAFRKYLENCPQELGTVTELFPFYALPYVPLPKEHEAFFKVFQDIWVQNLRSKLIDWFSSNNICPPTLLNIIKKSRKTSLNRSLGHREGIGLDLSRSSATADKRRSNRALRRRYHRLQDDYHKLLGVAMELTGALERSVRGYEVDLESTLTACTHRHPQLFNQCFVDIQGAPASILLETIQRSRLEVSQCHAISPLKFSAIKLALQEENTQNVLLLLQSLRLRITKITSGESRLAVVTSYVRHDILGILGKLINTENEESEQCNLKIVENNETTDTNTTQFVPWTRLKVALTNLEPNLLGQTTARFLSTLASFPSGRTYLAKNSLVSSSLLQVLQEELGDTTTQDLSLSALQKLSVRGDVQNQLISKKSCIIWVARSLVEGIGTMSLATQECCAALLLNLLLRSQARTAAISSAPFLLKTVLTLLEKKESTLVSYFTGIMYSLLSEPLIKQEACKWEVEQTISKFVENSENGEYAQHMKYLLIQSRREEDLTPPVSPPDSPNHLQEIPEFLEEELDTDDMVRSRPDELVGERLLETVYSTHFDEDYLRSSPTMIRSAPSFPTRMTSVSGSSRRPATRPHSDLVRGVNYNHHGFSSSLSNWDHQDHEDLDKSMNRTDAWCSSESLQNTSSEADVNPRAGPNNGSSRYQYSSYPYTPLQNDIDKVIAEEVEPKPTLQPRSSSSSSNTIRPRTSIIRRGTQPQSNVTSPHEMSSAITHQSDISRHGTPENLIGRPIQPSSSDQTLNRNIKTSNERRLPHSDKTLVRHKIDNRNPSQYYSNDNVSNKNIQNHERKPLHSSQHNSSKQKHPTQVIKREDSNSSLRNRRAGSTGDIRRNGELLTRKNTYSTSDLQESIGLKEVVSHSCIDPNENFGDNSNNFYPINEGHDFTEVTHTLLLENKRKSAFGNRETTQHDNDSIIKIHHPPSPLSVNDYVAVFGSRPKVLRTPPDSAERRRSSTPPPSSAHAYRQEYYESDKKVLPPISKTNKSYSMEES